MMVGHSMLAFALLAGAGTLLGWSRERALAAGAAAAAFAVVPDADMVYALSGLATASYSGVFAVTNAFWGASTAVHRSATHSLVLGAPAAVAFSLWTLTGRRRRWGRAVALFLLSALVGISFLATMALDAAVVAVFAAAGLAVASVLDRRHTVAPRVVLAAALVGLLTHPFGDVFTGTPPLLLYPLDVEVLAGRVVLHPDPTLNLLGVFGLELATVWIAAAVYFRVDGGRSPLGPVDRRAVLGLGYAPLALVFAPPTLDVSYHFVLSVLAFGGGLATPSLARLSRPGFPVETSRGPGPGRALAVSGDTIADDGLARVRRVLTPFAAATGLTDRSKVLRWLSTGTATVTLAWLGYLAVYVLA